MRPGEPEFWRYLDQLVAASEVVIDRPKGSTHPRYSALVYPVDYGHLADTTTVDGSGIDVWVGAGGTRQVVGVVCTVDLYRRDIELKILLGCSAEEIAAIMQVHNGGSMRGMLLLREDS